MKAFIYAAAILAGILAGAAHNALADDIIVTEGVGKTVAFDSIGGINFQRMKLIYGPNDTNSGDVSTSNPLPTQLRNSSGTEIGTNSNPVAVSDGAGSLTVDGTVAATQSGTWTVQPGNTANTTAWLVKQDRSDSYLSIDLDESEEQVSSSPVEVRGYYYRNESLNDLYIKLYNATDAGTTVGTTTPKLVFPIPAKSAANVQVPSVYFDTALTAACTTGILHTNTGAPGANECILNIYYK